MEYELGIFIYACRLVIHDNKVIALKFAWKVACWVDGKGCSHDKHQVTITGSTVSIVIHVHGQWFIIQYDVWSDEADAFAVRASWNQFFTFEDTVRTECASAFGAVTSVYGTMDFIDFAAAGFAVKPVNILCYDRDTFAGLF